MNNLNSGYHGMSRSVRSHEAIQEFEMPLSLINRQAVDNYIKRATVYLQRPKLKC